MCCTDEPQSSSTELSNACKPSCRLCATEISIVVPDANGIFRNNWSRSVTEEFDASSCV
jgi:hypothetical protein